jgi:NADH-quinone oxidoreductase subunit G
MEAVARTAAHLLGADDTLPLEWHAFRGVHSSVKTAVIPGVGKVAVCNGIATAQHLLESDSWRDEFVAIEVMSCVGGCLGGGGEPKSMDPDVLHKRMKAVYAIDRDAPRRRSFENPDIQALYASELGQPNSPAAETLLHTAYAPRGSKRLMLMRFLDCVDRRDGPGAAALLHPKATWLTASPFGDLHGASTIVDFIEHQLPPRRFGPADARHRMTSAADADDLSVIAANGEACRFDVELETLRSGQRTRTVIRGLVRHVETTA